jgi:hypothetical protein
MNDFTSCPHCKQPFGKIVHNDPKLISFENRSYQINVHRTWVGMKWSEPGSYELYHWCPQLINNQKRLYKVRAKTIEELKQKWSDHESIHVD